MIDPRALKQIEESQTAGLTSAQILDVFARHGVQLSEASLRKYVQLGLLPRSRRIGKGAHRGSQGVYPAAVVRQIARIKRLVAEGHSIEQIRREFLFVRADLDVLERTLDGIFATLDGVTGEKSEACARLALRDVADARALAKDLVARLVAIESRLTSPMEVERVIAS